MDNLVLELVDALRVHGVRCSTAEVVDALRAVELCGVQQRAVVKRALGLTLAKTQAEKQAFEVVFEGFFGLPSLAQKPQATPPKTSPASRAAPGDPTHTFHEGVANGTTEPPHRATGGGGHALPTANVANHQQSAFLAARRAAHAVSLRNVQIFTQRGRAINQMLQFLLQEAGLTKEPDPTENSEESLGWQARRKAVHQLVEGYMLLYAQPRMKRLLENSLRHTHFSRLSPQDVERAQAMLKRMAKHLNQPRRLQTTGQKGPLDVRRTLRRNVAYGGPLLYLHWRRRHRPPPKVFAICDVSGSMVPHARFLLLLLHSLHLAMPKLRCFAFSSTLHEIGGLFRQHPPMQAMEAALRQVGGGATHYGNVWEGFLNRCQGALTPRSVVLVQGDGRNNYGDAKRAYLRQIERKVKAIFWFNPEMPSVWGTGDSEMLGFAQHCKGVWPCANLDQLETAVHGVVQKMG